MKNLTILQINDLHGYLAPHSEILIWGAMNACSPAEARTHRHAVSEHST